MEQYKEILFRTRLADDLLKLLYDRSLAEMQRQIDVAQTPEKAGLKQTLRSMIVGCIDRSLDDIRLVIANRVDEIIQTEKQELQQLIRDNQQAGVDLKNLKNEWVEESNEARLVERAQQLFIAGSIDPKDSYGIAQYNRSLGLVLSAALGLKSIGAPQEIEKERK